MKVHVTSNHSGGNSRQRNQEGLHIWRQEARLTYPVKSFTDTICIQY